MYGYVKWPPWMVGYTWVVYHLVSQSTWKDTKKGYVSWHYQKGNDTSTTGPHDYSILYDINIYIYIYTYIFMIYVSAFSIYKQKQTCSENLYQPSSKRFKFRPKALPPTLADGCASHPHGYQSAWHSAAHVGRALPRRNLWQSRGCPWRMEVVLKPKYEIHRNSIWVWLFPMTHGIQNQCIYIYI